jgi:glutamate dehydrogenase (NADP+)
MAIDLDGFMADIERRNPGETEFLQAVREVAEKVVPFVNQHPRYEKARVLTRMT